jgi:hypothetical protein
MIFSFVGCSSKPIEELPEIAEQDEDLNTVDEDDNEDLDSVLEDNEEDVIDPAKSDDTEDSDASDISDYIENGIINSERSKEIIKDTAYQVLELIKNKDMDALSDYVHPEFGVRFSPYSYVSPEKDIVMNQDQIKSFFEDETEYTWGNYDGSGEPIKMTPNKYYEEFIYSKDFMNAEEISYNKILSEGNINNNQFEIYAKSIVAEYYFSGFEEQYGGADWQSIRLVFQELNGTWYLVGIIHNQMTI